MGNSAPSGGRSDFEGCRRVFESCGNTLKLLGGLGTGRICKILNKALFTGTLKVAHQAVRRARVLALDEEAMRGGLMASSAQSMVLSVTDLLDAPATAPAMGNLVKNDALFATLVRAAGSGAGDLEHVAGKTTKTIGDALE